MVTWDLVVQWVDIWDLEDLWGQEGRWVPMVQWEWGQMDPWVDIWDQMGLWVVQWAQMGQWGDQWGQMVQTMVLMDLGMALMVQCRWDQWEDR